MEEKEMNLGELIFMIQIVEILRKEVEEIENGNRMAKEKIKKHQEMNKREEELKLKDIKMKVRFRGQIGVFRAVF